MHKTDLKQLQQDANPITHRLGIGLITYNRLDHLKNCVERIKRFTKIPYYLVIADDGSSDGSLEWCLNQELPVISGKNHGVVWNKNRALYALINETDAKCILLLEDDCWPNSEDWAQQWYEATYAWHHINFAHPNTILSRTGSIITGTGTPENPYQSKLLTGQCTGCSRSAMDVVGYLDTRFRGYGYGHVEWTRRFLKSELFKQGNGGTQAKPFIYPCIVGGLEPHDGLSFGTQEQLQYNNKVFQSVIKDSIYREPWNNEEEKLEFLQEVSSIPNLKKSAFNNQKSFGPRLFKANTRNIYEGKGIVSDIQKITLNTSVAIMGLDKPGKNTILSYQSGIEIFGWVIGRKSKATLVEFVCNDQVVHTTSINHYRLSVSKAYPKDPQAINSGFKALISNQQLLEAKKMLIQFVLEDKSRVPGYLIEFSQFEFDNSTSLQSKNEELVENISSSSRIISSDFTKKGNKLKRSGKLEEAIQAYQKAIELNPSFSWAYYSLGEALFEQVKFDNANAQPSNASLKELKQEIEQSFKAQLSAYKQILKKVLFNEYRQVEALLNLHSLISLNHPLPPLRQWPLSPDIAVIIYSLILELKPRSVLELGSGSSSLIIGYALDRIGEGKVTSLEHDQKYSQLSQDLVIKHKLEGYCSVKYAPLVDTTLENQTYKYYCLDSIEDNSKFDMLVIDSPPGATNPQARFPAIPLLYDRLSPGAIVILCDADRPGEKSIVKRWLQDYEKLKTFGSYHNEEEVYVILKEDR
ncbi:MAG: tetratricopeptide repeat protein [Xenococcus sp. (in: cyanobacteria)]